MFSEGIKLKLVPLIVTVDPGTPETGLNAEITGTTSPFALGGPTMPPHRKQNERKMQFWSERALNGFINSSVSVYEVELSYHGLSCRVQRKLGDRTFLSLRALVTIIRHERSSFAPT
jgi:hypothetical protein